MSGDRIAFHSAFAAVVVGFFTCYATTDTRLSETPSRESSKRVDGLKGKRGMSRLPHRPLPGQEWKDPGSGITFVWIPPGRFRMGAKAGEQPCAEELPPHNVTIKKGFWLGKYELTQGQWEAVMSDNPSSHRGDNLPVDWVSWTTAKEFLRALSLKGGRQYCLPTEAQWEYACRAGSTTQYYWGDKMNEGYCWWAKNSGGEAHPVGQKKPNSWGLYDMIGNVDEWCEDTWHASYKGAPSDGSTWIAGNESDVRILRGGSWKASDDSYLRCAWRFAGGSQAATSSTGFRCVVQP